MQPFDAQSNTSQEFVSDAIRGGKSQIQNTGRGGLVGLTSRLNNTGNTRGITHEFTEACFDAISKMILNRSLSYPATATLLDNKSNMALALSTIVLYVFSEDKKFVAASGLMIEGSRRLNPINITGHGQTPIQIDRPAAECYDSETSRLIMEVAAEDFPGATLIDAGVNIIPLNVASQENLENSAELSGLLFHALNAAIITLNQAIGSTEFILSAAELITDRTVQLTANIDPNPASQLQTASGRPVRTDVIITTAAAVSENNNVSKFSKETDITIAGLYIDLAYIDSASIPTQSGPYAQVVERTQRYRARAVVTTADTNLAVVTMEGVLLGLSSVTAMDRDNAWMRLFTPRYNKSGIDLRDIGAIGYECTHLTQDGQPARIDTRSDAFASNNANLAELLNAAIFPGLIYSMDILPCDDLGWIYSAFLAAARGNTAAINEIIQSCDNLTSNEFSKIWRAGTPIANYDNTLVPVGYYTDNNGEKRDLRDYDYLAMLNIMGPKGDMAAVEDFSDFFDQAGIPEMVRLNKYIERLRTIIGPSLEIKGFAHRITFNNEFLIAFNNALAKVGFAVRTNSVGVFVAGSGRRGNTNVLQQPSIGNAGYFNYGNQGGGYANATFSPYSRY